ncbi:MAG TPA: hypothetical protein VH230_08800 [Stellaceae bacterium]|jgi:hypothetical protein|nr:hypothetical protein [Stellaceae bacterium]
MSLARTAALAATALFILCSAARAAGPYRPFQIGLWLGGAYTDDRTGNFSHCSAGVVYDGGINLFVVSTEAHGWWLGFTSPHWSLTPSASIPVKLQFDGLAPLEVLGTITDGQLLLVPAPDESHLVDIFLRSSRIVVTAQERSFSLSLAATSGVLSELANCVRNSIALEPSRPAPPPSAAAAATPPQIRSTLVARNVTELEEIKLAQNFLLAAGLPNAHLIDTGKPAALASFTAVWRSDDAAGAVKIIYPGRDVTGASIASDLISVDPKLCKGNFGAVRSSEVVDGAVVARAALSCVEGEDDRTAQYFVTPRQRGGFVVFAVIGNNAAGGSTPNRLNSDLLGRAALRAAAPGD